ncbi:MAG: prephenate dehydrogenase/arogenate dehydrogenase family protein [Candidatus Gastranaerophilales bacterium]|nr:prephenate dehydrogenase/arogenate dehydrogenase family protein [Candidatus Gastranaerophilales bacterium]
MKIGIVALGLIGGSLLKALYKYNIEMTVVTRNNESLDKAKKYADIVSSDYEVLKNCNIVFVCTPISKTLETLDLLENILPKSAIVCDVASVKEFVMAKTRPYKFIGTHPMAGTEHSGFEYSFDGLFEGAKWVITPQKNVSQDDIAELRKIIELTGANIIEADAKSHDEAVALISHMPMLVAQSIFKAAEGNELALKLAASGFRDTTRLAMSNAQMAQDMMNFNGNNIQKACEKMVVSLNQLNNDNYKFLIEKIKTAREKMYSPEGKNIIE